MRWMIGGLLLCTTGCVSAAPTSFVLEDPASLAHSARLVMCNSNFGFERKDDALAALQRPGCSGSAFIEVVRTSGGNVRCEIDYLEAGAEQHWFV
jgi:hypothetical protein